MQQAKNVALVYSFVCGKCQQRRIKTHFTSLLTGSLLPPIWGLYTMYSQNFRSIAMLWCSTCRFRRIIWNCGGICKYKIEAYACVFHESEMGVSISNQISFYKTIQLWVTSTNFMHTPVFYKQCFKSIFLTYTVTILYRTPSVCTTLRYTDHKGRHEKTQPRV